MPMLKEAVELKEKIDGVANDLIAKRSEAVNKYIKSLAAQGLTQHAIDYINSIRALDIHIKALITLGAEPKEIPEFLL